MTAIIKDRTEREREIMILILLDFFYEYKCRRSLFLDDVSKVVASELIFKCIF